MVFIVVIMIWAVAVSVSSMKYKEESFAYYSMYRAVKEQNQNLIEKKMSNSKGEKLEYASTYILFAPIYPFTF